MIGLLLVPVVNWDDVRASHCVSAGLCDTGYGCWIAFFSTAVPAAGVPGLVIGYRFLTPSQPYRS